MHFGALACLDAWLWTFTILPMRFCIALGVLVRWWGYVVGKEARYITGFVWEGLGRMWQRARRGRITTRAGSGRGSAGEESRSRSRMRETPPAAPAAAGTAYTIDGQAPPYLRRPTESIRAESNGKAHHHHNLAAARSKSSHQGERRCLGHRRTKSMPSSLTSTHKADLLQGAIIIFSTVALMHLDASRMYHFIRAQSAVKLYVIYNLVEVGDRLLSAVGQDILECLFSSETLSRNASGRSKVLLPFGMFLLSLAYNVAHAVVLFYQVITLNVAVNSYSNALLSLLMSNQFVEVKSSVFKRLREGERLSADARRHRRALPALDRAHHHRHAQHRRGRRPVSARSRHRARRPRRRRSRRRQGATAQHLDSARQLYHTTLVARLRRGAVAFFHRHRQRDARRLDQARLHQQV